MILALFAAIALAQDPAPTDDALPIVAPPSIQTYVEAPYPPDALAAGLTATVTVRIALSATGEVESIEVVTPQGHGFDEAAVDAILAMQWTPARTEAGPVPVVFEFAYGFQLEAPPAPEAAPPPVNFEGRIREMGDGHPIAGATVAIDGTDQVATTDDDGRFTLRGVPLGAHDVRVLHVGHLTETRSLTFADGEVTVANLWLRAEAYRENELVATYVPPKDEVTRRTLTIEEVKRIPGTFGDPVKVIQTLPGAARSPFGTGLLVIRGANPEDSGVYVDGIRIPIIYHLTGTTSVLAPDLVEAVDYLPGGYGVQFGRSMGGVVDVRTRRTFSETPKLVWGTDILDSNVYFEGQVGPKDGKRHGVAAGVRRSYIDAFIPFFVDDTFTIRPRYWDYQVKWMAPTDGDSRLSAFVYGFDDVLAISTPDETAQGSDADTQGDLKTQYNSHRLIVQYHRDLSETLSFDLTPSVGVDGAYFGLGDAFTLDNTNGVAQVRAEASWQATPAVAVVPGLDFIAGLWRFDFASAVRVTDLDDPLAEREGVGFDGRGTLWSPDPYLRLQLRPLRDRDRWLISPGIRGEVVTLTTAGSVAGEDPVPAYTVLAADPRLLTRFQATPTFAIKGATGQYHQPPQPQEIVGTGVAPTVGYESAWSHTLGVEHRIRPAVQAEVEAFYRDMRGLIVFNEAWTGFGTGNPFVNQGDGRAYGVEVIVRHDPAQRFFGWVSYTLSRSSRRDQATCGETETEPDAGALGELLGYGPCWYRFDFDQTHIFSAQGGYELPYDFAVSAQVQAVTGNPDTGFNAGVYDADGDFYNGFSTTGYNDDRLPPFFQTSLRVDKRWTFQRWQLDTYVDLLNAVRGVNPEFTLYNYDYSEKAYVRGLPFIPNVGFEAKFWP
jgi:TonB family protein